MDKLVKLYSWLSRPTQLIFGGGIILFLILQGIIERAFVVTLYDPIITHFIPAIAADIGVIAIALMYTVWVLARLGKFRPRPVSLAWTGLTAVLYTYYRFFSTDFEVYDLVLTDQLKYLDLIYVPFLGNLVLLASFKENIIPATNAFREEKPLGTGGKDLYNYENYARSLSQKLVTSKFDNCFAVGVNGPWGSGKTSFIDLLKRNIEEEDAIVVDFNIWRSQSAESVQSDFFVAVQRALRQYHSNLAYMVRKYSDQLSGSRSIGGLLRVLNNPSQLAISDTESLRSEIDRALAGINRKLFIIIDDVDRLGAEEIIELIKLIRNTANFSNTYFIVAYDRNYLVNAIRDHSSYGNERFLDKIFQLEISLPLFDKNVLRYELAKILKNSLPTKLHEVIDTSVIGTAISTPEYFNTWLENMRDVVRLSNSIILNMESLYGEAILSDFARIELVRIKYPSVYGLLASNPHKFLNIGAAIGAKEEGTYRLRMLDGEQAGTSVLEEFIRENHVSLSVPLHEVQKIVEFIESIFPDEGFMFGTRHHLSITYPSKFERYFKFQLSSQDLSEQEFSTLFDNDFDQIKEIVASWVKNGLRWELRKRLKEITAYESRDQYELVLKTILYFANLPIPEEGNFTTTIVGYDGNDLSNKLNHTNENVLQLYDGSSANLIAFLKSLFNPDDDQFLYESAYLQSLDDRITDDFVINREDRVALRVRNLAKYCETADRFDHNCYSTYHRCRSKTWVQRGGGSYTEQPEMTPDARAIIREFLDNEDKAVSFLQSAISPEPFERKTFKLNDFVEEIFEGHESFKARLEEWEEFNNEQVNEFKEFYLKSEEQNHSAYIVFEFKHLKLTYA